MAKRLKQHSSEDVETITVILNPEKYPKVFQQRVNELMDPNITTVLGKGRPMTQEEAEIDARQWMLAGIEMEIYYEHGGSLFALDAETVEAKGDFHSPFTKRKYGYNGE
jgi:hypothetical protein